MYQDKTLVCRDCGQEFVFTAGEQEFYAEKGFQNDPSRCPVCRQSRKQQSSGRSQGGYGRTQRQMYPAVCAGCGVQTEVPFQPSGDKPVYCRDCYQAARR
ncbi:MAG: zinc-ribbon domain containing protein [Desulfitobacterium hafniense]|nr:zinc-ribbon domain containing protein [Desulfitobacterium hafniense]